MKRVLTALLLLAFCATASAGGWEEPNALELELPCWSGSDYIWMEAVSEEGIVSIMDAVVEDGRDPAEGGGSGSVQWIRIDGLKPGEVTVTFTLVMMDCEDEPEETLQLRLRVDSDLNVLVYGISHTLGAEEGAAVEPGGEVRSFELYISGNEEDTWLQVVPGEDGTKAIAVDGETVREADAAFLERLAEIIEQFDIVSWDGFLESDTDTPEDGDAFTLEITWENGWQLEADGYNVYPPFYNSAVAALVLLFQGN